MEIEIFPKRLLSSDTVEEILKNLVRLESVKNVILQGPNLPKYVVVPSREHPMGLKVETGHEDLTKIKFGDGEIELKVKVGRIIIQPIKDTDLDNLLQKLKDICNDFLPFGFDIRVNFYKKGELI
ncbi:MAG: methyl-coenzyme M reductase operon protein D [Candidatus Methylarchaceae archaeon HK01B]|nr:methyl-coenzyme M reductase operon protein D [Candidatus Methylarchaceae archaeon HK01M]MCP8311399.1 methyl-coenzyme M reductase operon protein D [Candidatus Methylarchaceae archaeon HK02M1]MCP8318347.1 methyl-coenzyme M reductase operon protein D [Candidatus Methylarchaceae archaeon HK01B]